MLDLKFIAENKALVKQAQRSKNQDETRIDLICELYEKKRKIQAILDEKRHQLKKASEQFAKSARTGSAELERLKQGNIALKNEIKVLEDDFGAFDRDINEALSWVANIPHETVPVGKDAKANVIVREPIKPRHYDFKPKDHIELSRKLGIIEWDRQAKLAGSNFVVLAGKGAALQRALIDFMLELHTGKGYKEFRLPYIAQERVMFNSAQLPKFREDMYELTRSDGFLIPTAEVPLMSLHMDEILSHDQLPLKYTAYTPCFRREAGAYGAETKGIIRVHQFDKVELVKLTRPEDSYKELELMVNDAEAVLQALNIPYRVVLLSTGDMSFASAKTYDIEIYSAGLDRWLEISSCSNCTDFQTRRAMIRFRDEDGKVKYPHSLNGSGTSLARLVIAIIENSQTSDGKIAIPEPLWKYTGFRIID